MRRTFAACMVGTAFALAGATLLAHAQAQPKMFRIGWLSNAGVGSGDSTEASDFQQGLRDAGYAVKQNVVIEFRYAEGDTDRLWDFASELARLPVDVIVTSGDSAAEAAKRSTKVVPIVATEFGQDPVKSGLVKSLGHPEGNITGLASVSEDLWGKRLSLLHEFAPKVRRLAALWNPSNRSNAICVDELNAAATALSMQIRAIGVRDAKGLEQAFLTMAKEPTDAIAICWDDITLVHAKAIADFALSRRLPTVAPLKEYAKAGALLSYGANLSAQRRRSAYYVKKILNGAKPAELPVERPTMFELVVNKRTARALGLALPQGIALLADDLLE